jgi:hypothetical protein
MAHLKLFDFDVTHRMLPFGSAMRKRKNKKAAIAGGLCAS